MTKKILILAANPKGSFTLEIPREIREILEGLQRSRYREQFEVEERLAVRPQDLRRAMLEVQPHIVHFCGHGMGDKGLVLENDRGQEHVVSTEALSDLFRLFSEQVGCVVLNACYSEVQAKAISQHINYVIGMRQEIIDQAAIAFSIGFYDALGAGREITFAYDVGCNAIQFELPQQGITRKANPVITGNEPPPLPTHLIPVLLTKETVTPTKPMARYALVIGVSEYQNQQFHPLPQAANNAEAVAQLLESYGNFQVERLSANLSKEAIWQALKSLLWERSENAYALVYFAGYGLRLIDELEEEKGFLVPSNCQPEMVGEKLAEAHQGISLTNLNRLIAKSQAQCLIMVLDCCHRGSFLPNQLLQQSLSAFTMQKDYYLLAAGIGEHPIKTTSNRHSLFTAALLQGLSAANAGSEGQITGKRLQAYVRQELEKVGQTPLHLGGGASLPIVTHLQNEQTPTVTFNPDNPYLGLHAFSAEQQQYFHGRDRAIRALLDRLSQSRFLAVLGASGCGKSSLVKAGVLPRLEREQILGNKQWRRETFTPGNHPLESINDKLDLLHSSNQPFILFIDQFEEVFTLCKDNQERRAFFRLLEQQINNNQHQCRIIVAMRSDFLDHCAEYTEIADLINSTQNITNYLVEPLDTPELTAAIQEPARLHGVRFDAGLVEGMVADVINQPGALPLLQYALRELWRVCLEESESPPPLLNWRCYQQIGRVGGALDNQATRLYNSFVSSEDRDFVRLLFLELVELGEGDTVTRRRVTRESLAARADSGEQLEDVLGRLVQKRLIVITSVRNAQDSLETYVEVTHEALLTQWELLQGWIEDNRENLRIERRFEADFREWRDRYGESEEALLSGVRLSAVEEWRRNFQPRLSQQEEEFINRSVGRRERENQQKLDRERKLRELAEGREKIEKQKNKLAIRGGIVLAFLAIVSSGLAIWAMAESKRATNNEIQALIQSSETFLETNNQLEALIESVKALQKIKTDKTPKKIINIISKIYEKNRLEGHIKNVNQIDINPINKNIASASADHRVKIWNKEGKNLFTLPGHKNHVSSVDFSYDGNFIASTDLDGNIKIWNAKTNYIQKELNPTDQDKKGSIAQIKFNPKDNNIIASAEFTQKSIRIWNIEKQSFFEMPEAHNNEYIASIDFDRNGQKIASGGHDNNVKIWQITDDINLIKIRIMTGHTNAVLTVTFSHDGNLIASAGHDKNINIWRVSDGRNLAKTEDFEDHNDSIYSLAFSPDDQSIASTSNKIIKVFRWKEKQKIAEFIHKSRVNTVVFLSNELLIAGDDDGIIKIWSLIPQKKHLHKVKMFSESCRWLENYLNNNVKVISINKDICL